MGNLGLVSALLFEPRKAFAEIETRPRYLFPLLLILLGTIGMAVWYQAKVDIEWLTDLQLHNNPLTKSLKEDVIQARVKAAGAANPAVRLVATAILGSLVVTIILLLSAGYNALAGKVTNVQRSFRQWLALTCWTGLPVVLTVIPAAITLLTATTRQLEPVAMQPLSVNALFLDLPISDPGYSLFTSLTLPTLLTLYLAAVGVKLWSGRSWLFSAIFVALPSILIYGIWAFIALGRS